MKCERRRTLLNLFEVYDCKKCEYYHDDEYFVVGNTHIFVYYLFNLCHLDNENIDYLFYYSRKITLFYKDAIINHDNILFLFIEDFNIEKYFDILNLFLNMNLDLQILTL